MRPRTYFEIEFEVSGSPGVRMSLSAKSEADVLAFAKENLQPNAELFVACLGDGVDYGNLIIEVDAQGYFDVHAHEHRGFLVKHISEEQALSALEYWLPWQGRASHLEWLDE